MLLLKNESVKQGIKYLVVGGGTALLELGFYSLFFYILHWSIPVANVLAVLVATLTNFLVNRSWAFKSSKNIVYSMVLYILLFAANLFITTTIISFGTAAGLPSAGVKLATQVLVATWNFFLYRYVIFKQ